MVSTRKTSPAAGLDVLALKTPTLPPATTTNTSLVGREHVWVVDPATPHDAERAVLLEALQQVRGQGRVPRGIVLTHHHRDHVGAAAWLREQAGLPVHAHPRTAELLEGQVAVDELLEEGAVLRGSDAPDDAWRVLHTPGHASGHIVLWEPRRRLAVVGDMVAAEGTIVVEPPDGHMATYIAQLRRLRELDPAAMVPAHGGVIEDPAALLDYYVKHRLEREAKVLEAVRDEPDDLMAITRRAYTDVPEFLHVLASRSALAHLIKLVEDGRVSEAPPERWRIAAGAPTAR